MPKILQAVVLMMLVAVAASCSVGKEYTTRVFAKPKTIKTDSTAVAVRFLEMDSLNHSDDMIVVTLPGGAESAETKVPQEKPEPESIPVKKDVARNKKTRDN